MATDHPTPSKPRRRWFQFSLRTLFVAVFLLSVLFAWLGPWTQSALRIRHVEETIHKMGGTVQFGWYGPGRGAYVDLNGPLVTDKELKDLVELRQPKRIFITSLDLKESSVTNKGLEHLKGLTKLETLSLNNTQVTDAGLVHLKGLTNLQVLHIVNAPVTDDGLEHLNGLTNPKAIFLFNTQVTDEDVKKLQQALPNCKIYR